MSTKARWDHVESPSRFRFLIEHDLRANAFRVCREGKPLHTFPEYALVCVACGEVAGDFRAFVDIAAEPDQRRRRAGAVGLLEAVIAAIEARDHARAPLAAGRFRID